MRLRMIGKRLLLPCSPAQLYEVSRNVKSITPDSHNAIHSFTATRLSNVDPPFRGEGSSNGVRDGSSPTTLRIYVYMTVETCRTETSCLGSQGMQMYQTVIKSGTCFHPNPPCPLALSTKRPLWAHQYASVSTNRVFTIGWPASMYLRRNGAFKLLMFQSRTGAR